MAVYESNTGETMNILRIDLLTNTIVTDDAPYVSGVMTMPPETWADLTARGYPNVGYWPVIETHTAYDGASQYLGEAVLSVDVNNKQLLSTRPVLNVSLAQIKTSAILKIDADTDAIYGAVLGNRAEEYTSAADDAAAYKLAGYTGTVPPGVQSWATAKGWTATQATDDILTTRGAWVAAQNIIRTTRLARKEQVRAAADAAGVTTVMTAWAGFVAYMRGQLGI